MIFAVNSYEPNVIITELTRTAAVLDGENAGRVMDGSMVRDIIGTCYNYGFKISARLDDLDSYDELYDIITAPDDSISLTVPYGQSLITFDAYVADTSDKLIRAADGNYFNQLTFNAITIDPQKVADEEGGGSGARSDAPFTCDGVGYNMLVKSLSRSSSILDGDEAGRIMSGHMERDIIGSYYNYSATIQAMTQYPEEYDSFYEAVTSPIDSHTFIFPYGQSSLTLEAYVANVSDKLLRVKDSYYYWGNMSLNFIAMSAARTP